MEEKKTRVPFSLVRDSRRSWSHKCDVDFSSANADGVVGGL